jgi:hypothetical protein
MEVTIVTSRWFAKVAELFSTSTTRVLISPQSQQPETCHQVTFFDSTLSTEGEMAFPHGFDLTLSIFS